MYVCICHEVTEKDIKKAIRDGACSIQDLRDRLNVGATCGSCEKFAEQCIKRSNNSDYQLQNTSAEHFTGADNDEFVL